MISTSQWRASPAPSLSLTTSVCRARGCAAAAAEQIIGYKASPDGKWLLLNGIAAGAGGAVTGQLQLYSIERGVTQAGPALFASRSLRRALLTPQANAGSCYRCSRSA